MCDMPDSKYNFEETLRQATGIGGLQSPWDGTQYSGQGPGCLASTDCLG